MKKYRPLIILIGICLVLVATLSYWAGAKPERDIRSSDDKQRLNAPLVPEEYEIYEPVISNDMNPVAVLETNRGVIEIELYKDLMPITAGNFEKLVSEGFYDGIQFHRVINGFMIQGGDPYTKTDNVLLYGTGGSDKTISDEHIAHKLLTNTRGTISMANSGPNSGSSQFFINLGDNSSLDFNDMRQPESKHPVFGRVIKGMEVVDAIASTETNQRDLPVEAVVIEKATIKE